LKDKLTKLGFIQSRFDECLFYYGKTIFLVYTDDPILVGPDEGGIEKIVRTLSKNFKVEDQGDLSHYLRVNIERRKEGKIEMTQPTLCEHTCSGALLGTLQGIKNLGSA
jgi:hypothetical protein